MARVRFMTRKLQDIVDREPNACVDGDAAPMPALVTCERGPWELIDICDDDALVGWQAHAAKRRRPARADRTTEHRGQAVRGDDKSALEICDPPRKVASSRYQSTEGCSNCPDALGIERLEAGAEQQPALFIERAANTGQEIDSREKRPKLPRQESVACRLHGGRSLERRRIRVHPLQQLARGSPHLRKRLALRPRLVAPGGRTGIAVER